MRFLLAFCFGILHKLIGNRRRAPHNKQKTVSVSRSTAPLKPEKTGQAQPDALLPFGYKNSWLCIPNSTPQEVMSRLDCEGVKPCTWERGLAEAEEDQQVFVSPCLDGFVLVIGLSGLEKKQLDRLAAGFEELQYFATHRTVGYQSWARYQAGQLERGYTYLGERGEVLWDEGPLTAEEIALGAMKFPRGHTENDWEHIVPPTEETVLDLAAAWGGCTVFRQTVPRVSGVFMPLTYKIADLRRGGNEPHF